MENKNSDSPGQMDLLLNSLSVSHVSILFRTGSLETGAQA